MSSEQTIAYETHAMPSEICVIYNPSAGRGRAGSRLQGVSESIGTRLVLKPTSGPGHAEELAYEAACDGFAVVGASGGDGTVHEVANGILRAQKPDCALTVLPVGSANDYAFSLGLGAQWWKNARCPPRLRSVDVGVIQTPNGKSRYFVNTAGLGFNGAVTFESRSVHHLQGVWLYTTALLQALWRHYKFPVIEMHLDDKVLRLPTLALLAALGKREGNFLLAPDAVVDDGLFDYLVVGRIGWWQVIRFLPAMIFGHLPKKHRALLRGRCQRMVIRSDDALFVHLDGEVFSTPADDLRNFEITLLPGRLQVWGRFSTE